MTPSQLLRTLAEIQARMLATAALGAARSATSRRTRSSTTWRLSMGSNAVRKPIVNESQEECGPLTAVQLPLGHVVQNAFGSAGEHLLAVIGEAIGASGKITDDLAADLDVDPGQFSRALNGRGAHFSVRWVPAILYRDRARILIRHLCHICGGEFVETPRLTPEQKLERLEKTLRDAGAIGDTILRAAFGEDT